MEISGNFDVIVIGGGPGGYHSANRAAQKGLSVALFEKDMLGGVCLKEGCIPSKTLLKCGKIYSECINSGKYGVTCENAHIDQCNVIERKNDIVKKLSFGVRGNLRKNKVKLFFNEAFIKGSENDHFIIECCEKLYSANNLIIATGSHIFIPPIKGVEDALSEGFVLNSTDILSIEKIPKSMVIIGGGVIGLEMASFLNSCGTKVTIIEYTDKICGNLDRECSDVLKKNFENKGIEFILSSEVLEIKNGTVAYSCNQELKDIECDKVLISTGRKPNISGYGLENLKNLSYDERGIKTDERMRTSLNGVCAVGDVNGKFMLAHTAYKEGEVAVDNICGRDSIIDYKCIPSSIYTTPEGGWVGESEESATLRGIDYKVYKLPLNFSGRFVAENTNATGICKIISKRETGEIIGGAIIGDYASEIVTIISNFVALRLKISDIDQLVFPHPTVCEIIKETINN